MTTEEYLEARKSPLWNFNQIVDPHDFLNVSRIHPIKQKMVRDIVSAAKKDNAVRKIIIFGSSTRYDCDISSDLDICIDWKEMCYDHYGVLQPFTKNMRKTISSVTRGHADVVNYGFLKDTGIENAVKNGVVVYEHNV